MNNIIAIIAFHRSGTSLIANWLVKMGVSMGKKQLNANVGNKFGHFEDEEILRFHQNVLNRKKIDPVRVLFNNLPIELTVSEKEQLRNIIQQRKVENKQWGWKEPRTCLFLKEWKELEPNINWLVLFRSYEQCVDSLLRRFFATNRKRKNIFLAKYIEVKYSRKDNLDKLANRFLEAWIVYNSQVLNFIQEGSINNTIVVDMDMLTYNISKNGDLLFDMLKNNWKIDLMKVSLDTIFFQSEYKKDIQYLIKYEEALEQKALKIKNKFTNLSYEVKERDN